MADLKEFQRKMEKTLDVLASDFAAVRAGRANAQVLDRITVEYYGQPSPINQVGTVSSPDPRTLVIQPWDGSLLKAIEKAIQTSDLGINPQNDGRVIRLVFPQLTEERRKDLTKQVRKYAEDAKVAVRNIRRDAVDYVKKAQKKGELTEDDQKKAEKDIQDLRQARQEDRRDVRQEGKGTDGDLSACFQRVPSVGADASVRPCKLHWFYRNLRRIPSVIFFGNTTSPYRAGRGKRRLWYGRPLFAFN